MRNAQLWCLLGLLCMGSTAISQVQQTSGAAEKAVLALEEQWLQSQRTNNADLAAPLLAEKFVYTGPAGNVEDKAALLAESKATKWASVELEDVRVTVFGSTAIATGVFKGKGTDLAANKPINEHTRWTDTWVKMTDGKWQCVAAQDSNVKM
jgi:ketosteroid isomerase-like protein